VTRSACTNVPLVRSRGGKQRSWARAFCSPLFWQILKRKKHCLTGPIGYRRLRGKAAQEAANLTLLIRKQCDRAFTCRSKRQKKESYLNLHLRSTANLPNPLRPFWSSFHSLLLFGVIREFISASRSTCCNAFGVDKSQKSKLGTPPSPLQKQANPRRHYIF